LDRRIGVIVPKKMKQIERTRKWRQYMHKGKRKTEEEENK
jgi:hypothetical protein